MLRELFARFRQNRRQAHDAILDLERAAIAEELVVAVLKDVSATGNEKLKLLKQVAEDTKEMEQGGDEFLAEAARAHREGLAALLATPFHMFPADPEARLEAMQVPSNGSTNSQPPAGLPGGSSPKALTNGTESHPSHDGNSHPDQHQGEPPRRPRGRPKGSKTKRPMPPDGPGSETSSTD